MNITTAQIKDRVITGTVVSAKMRDTVVVAVNRLAQHSKYRKYMRITKRYQAHDAGNTKNVGDRVSIQKCRPLSKHKHFTVVS